MKQTRIDRLLLTMSIIGYLLMAASFVMMPFDCMGIIPGLLFWSGLLVGAVLQIILEVRRRAFFASYHVDRKKLQKPANGLFSCRSNPFAAIADHVLIAGVIATILAFVFTKGSGFLCYIWIAITVFAFCMHCILNGRIYFHAKNQPQIRQVLEERNIQKKEGEGRI